MPAMADFGKTLLSPPVILAGVAIGAVLLIMGRGSSNTSSSNGPSGAELGATVTMNQAAMAAQNTQAAIAAQEGASNYNQDTIRQGQLLGFLMNSNNNNTVIANQLEISQAGITNNSITSSFNLAMDVQNSTIDLAKTYEAGQVAEYQQASNVKIAGIQADAQKYAAKQAAIGSIFGGITNALTGFATGGMSSIATMPFMGGGGNSGGNLAATLAGQAANQTAPAANPFAGTWYHG